jgi:hypothetical protein
MSARTMPTTFCLTSGPVKNIRPVNAASNDSVRLIADRITGFTPEWRLINHLKMKYSYESMPTSVVLVRGVTPPGKNKILVRISIDPKIMPLTAVTTVVSAVSTIRVYVDRIGSMICLGNADCNDYVGGSPGPGTETTLFEDVNANKSKNRVFFLKNKKGKNCFP